MYFEGAILRSGDDEAALREPYFEAGMTKPVECDKAKRALPYLLEIAFLLQRNAHWRASSTAAVGQSHTC